MGTLRIGTIGVGMALLALSSSAFGDIKAFHGGQCRVTQTWAIRPDVYGYWDVQINDFGFRNMSDRFNVVVMCPLIRDLNYSTTGAEVVAEVYDKDLASGLGTIRCAAISQYEEQSPANQYYDYLYAETTSTGYKSLSFGTLKAFDGNEGSYALRCELGPRDAIQHIYVNETAGTE